MGCKIQNTKFVFQIGQFWYFLKIWGATRNYGVARRICLQILAAVIQLGSSPKTGRSNFETIEAL